MPKGVIVSAATASTQPATAAKVVGDRLPPRVRTLAWWVFATQVLIIATGGAVRLTGSGLGCDTWPLCTADSLVHNPAMGIHSYIEFGNRTLFFLLEIVAILALISLWKFRKARPDLFWLTVVPTLSVAIQAVLGGITVLTHLNPYVVGAHFLVSIVLVMLAALLVKRTYEPGGRRAVSVSAPLLQITWIAAIFGAITIFMGTVLTGSGPHAGDGGVARNGLESAVVQTLHVAPAYITLVFTLLAGFLAYREHATQVRRWAGWAMLVMVAQIVVGIAQARLSLPPLLVGIHMVLAGLLAAALFLMLIETRQRVRKVVTA